MAIAVKSTLDVAFWFLDRALNDREYLQPQKMHRLMYLAQAYFAVAYHGRKLMPATFVADSLGPVEPTVFHAFSYGRPHNVESNPLTDTVSHFLDSIWRRFGQYTADQLTKKIADHPPIAEAMAKGAGTEITFIAIAKFYASEAAAKKGAPSVDNVVRPKVMRSQTGKPVSVTAWRPKAVPVKE